MCGYIMFYGGVILKIIAILLTALLVSINMLCTVSYASDWKLVNESANSKVYIDVESVEKLSEREIGTWQKWMYIPPKPLQENGRPVSFVLSYMRFDTTNKMLCITDISHYYSDGTHLSFPTPSCKYQKIVPDSIGYVSYKNTMDEINKKDSKVSSNTIRDNKKADNVVSSSSLDALVGTCKSKVISKDYLGAIKDCSSLLENNDAAIEARFWRSKANYHLKNYREALEDLNIVIEKLPNDIQALNNRGIVYRDMGKNDEALSDITRALLIDNSYFEAYMNRAKLNLNRFEYALAVDDYSKALSLNPMLESAYSDRAIAYLELKQPLKAMEDASAAIKINPKNQTAYLIRVSVYTFETRDFNSALKEINEAMKIDPTNYEAWYVAGRVFQHMKDPNKAVVAFTKALELSKQTAVEAYFLRGLAYYDLGNKKNALSDWKSFLSATSTDNPRRNIVLELIKKVE